MQLNATKKIRTQRRRWDKCVTERKTTEYPNRGNSGMPLTRILGILALLPILQTWFCICFYTHTHTSHLNISYFHTHQLEVHQSPLRLISSQSERVTHSSPYVINILGNNQPATLTKPALASISAFSAFFSQWEYCTDYPHITSTIHRQPYTHRHIHTLLQKCRLVKGTITAFTLA